MRALRILRKCTALRDPGLPLLLLLLRLARRLPFDLAEKTPVRTGCAQLDFIHRGYRFQCLLLLRMHRTVHILTHAVDYGCVSI